MGNSIYDDKVVIESVQGPAVNFRDPHGFTRSFRIRNWTLKPLSATTKLCIQPGGSKCFQPSFVPVGEVKSGGMVEVDMPHFVVKDTPEFRVNLSNIEEVTIYSLMDGDKVLNVLPRKALMCEYAGYLAARLPTTPGERFNVLCFGPKSSGKSSLISSLFTAVDPLDEVQLNIVQTHGLSDHCTKDFRRYLPPDPLPNVQLWDTWGDSPTTYPKDLLSKMVAGELPEFWDMARAPGSESEEEKKQPVKRMHAIVVFVPCSNVKDNDANLAKLGLKMADELSGSGLNPIYLLSRCDEWMEATERSTFLGNPNHRVEKLEELKDILARKVGVPGNTILHVAPYVKESSRLFERDRLLLLVLEKILVAASGYEKHMKK